MTIAATDSTETINSGSARPNSATSRQVVVTSHGGPNVLHLVEEPLPEPGPGDVRVQVMAAGVSAFDLIYRRWKHLPGRPPVPFTLGEDIVGVVDKVGAGVTSVDVGQTVAAGTWALGVGGGYAEHVCLPATELVVVPDGVDPAEAVCLVVNYLTAHYHLHQYGYVQRGERVLIHGAAGGVGSALLELAEIAGLETYATAARHQHELVTSLGATAIDYRHHDFVERILELTGDGVDVVIDPIGGAHHLWRCYRSLRKGGRLVWLGSAATNVHGLRVGPLSMATAFALRSIPDGKRVPSCPTLDKFAAANPDWANDTLTELLKLLAERKLNPVVGERIPLEDAARAHEILERGEHQGKLVLVTGAYQG